ncbi:MAG: glutamyl-queuosine tRNA(Asp) synthetase [Pseudomonadota bacterium]
MGTLNPAYVGRFAPSPTGALHAGSLVAALASWLDARAHKGRWLVRIEDVDSPRCVPGAEAEIMRQLNACGLVSDETPVRQSERSALYQSALSCLQAAGRAYPCACTRKDIEAAWLAQGLSRERHAELVYPGTCRSGLHGKPARAWRFAVKAPATLCEWTDQRLGPQQQAVATEVGDFVLKRADGLWAYQLAVVVDDGAQHITHVVRGEDLADNTARQLLLQQALGLPRPQYLHTPLVRGPNGEKLSKQNGAMPVDVSQPLHALNAAATVLGLPPTSCPDLAGALQAWTQAWAQSLQSRP